MNVYLLEHLMLYSDYEDTKFIGVFSSKAKAEKAIHELIEQPGFCNAPEIIDPGVDDNKSGFIIDKWYVDKATWEEGFG